MARRLTVSNLISEIRSLCDETNQEALDDVRDIIPSLNRAQDFACNILARSYEPPLLAYLLQTLDQDVLEFDIPEGAFEERVVKVEVKNGDTYVEIPRISYRDATGLESSARTPYPYAYSCIGQKIRLYPGSSGAYPFRIWYIKDPEPLVMEQGTVSRINIESNYVVVTGLGSDLVPDIDSFSSYVNFVDGQTGRIKGTCQIQSMSSNRITFRSTPTRSSVLNREVSGTLPEDLELDDLICTVDGTCISVLKKPVSNWIIQYSASELSSVKFGIESTVQDDIRKELEKQVERSWAGREQSLRIKLKSGSWQHSYIGPFART